ncbi:MAG: hypothetical protein AAF066_19345 [Pseudomonadota bacterium]
MSFTAIGQINALSGPQEGGSKRGETASKTALQQFSEIERPEEMQLPTPTPLLTRSLSPQECEDHRKRIAIEVEIVLDGYWKDRPSPQMRAAIFADWMDTLEDWHTDQIRHCLRRWRELNPNKKPNPGHILGMLKGERGKAYVAQRDGGDFNRVFSVNREQKKLAAS